MSQSKNQKAVQGQPCFKPVSSKVDLPKMEEAILQFWKERDIFHRTESEREGSPLFMLFEGPPTANGSPGIHHVLSRAFKDVIPRYKTMKGFRPLRKGGWDTHGLPVELEIEKELGLSTKQEIESYGVERFNARCRESVFRYVKEWEDLTERIAFWVDMEKAYATLTNDYIETGWWMLKQLWERGLVYSGMKVTPHCPRCVTTLSSHEVALGYEEDTPDPSIYVKFQVDIDASLNYTEGLPKAKEAVLKKVIGQIKDTGQPVYLLAWTTTPWTLPGNVALAVNPEAEYALVSTRSAKGSDEVTHLILAKALLRKAITGKCEIKATFLGRDLAGIKYNSLYDPFAFSLPPRSIQQFYFENIFGLFSGAPSDKRDMSKNSWQVHVADYVSLEDGTGVVHTAPAFGADDFSLGGKEKLLIVWPVNLQGRFEGSYPFAGKFVKEADKDIRRDLRDRGLLYRDETIRHTYPFCWRCKTPLLYYAKSSWYIRTTAIKERLISANREINWYPEHIKEGRFGEWLQNNVDWAVSRERFWGTPLPIWLCRGCGNIHCVGSVEEIRDMAHREAMEKGGASLEECLKDLHRPYIDMVVLKCPRCEGPMRRTPEVLDAWFDSGAMPLAQWHYPFESEAILEDGRYPADYICEAVDQTRGWFYSLLAIATLLEAATGGKVTAPSYRNVICLGLILDARGEKMSKSKGNVVEPWPVIRSHGADALRWYLFTAAPPGNARRFSADLVGEAVRRFILTLWNTYSFFVTYANIDRFHPSLAKGIVPSAEMDRWILSELNSLVASVTDLLDNYSPTDAARRIEEFVEELSNWYVRRSRRRFWKSESDQDKLSAHATLYRCLVTLSRLLAPFTPFLAEEMYQNMVRSVDSSAPESVHLSLFPQADASQIDRDLSNAIGMAIRLSSLGRSARSRSQIKVRQPLRRALARLRSADEERLFPRIADQVAEELNVKEVALMDEVEAARFFKLRLNMALVGPRLGGGVRELMKAFDGADKLNLYSSVAARQPVKTGDFTLEPDEIEITLADVKGYSAAMEGGYLVAVTTDIPENLQMEGLARELVHRIQGMRRSAGFDIADYIVTYYKGDEVLKQVMESFGDYIRQETLSRRLIEGEPPKGAYIEDQRVDGATARLGVAKESGQD